MPGGVRWLSGRAEVQRAVDGWRAGAIPGEVLRDNHRRRLARIAESGAGDLMVKHFRVGSGHHAIRETWKARLGWSPAAREYRALEALWAQGVAVPEPLALGELPEGDRVVVMGFLPGVPLEEILTTPQRARAASLTALGAQVHQLHQAGYVHRDLHGDNLVFSANGPILLDLQRARQTRSARARHQDLGDLDYSLWGRASLADRLRIRCAALDIRRPFSAADRDSLRAVGRAARRRAFAHGRSRTRRALRPGRLYARLRLDAERGLRVRDVPEDAIAAALAAHREALAAGDRRVLEADERSRITAVRAGERPVIVKEVLPRGLGRMLADALRGSPARRAWLGGHGLLARGVGSARPLAFVERRRAGTPLHSLLVLERLEGPDALEAARTRGEATLEALVDLLDALHRRQVDHGDLKATNVFVGGEASLVPRLIDLESVRFPRRLSDERRLACLAQLNASLPDEIPSRLRRRVLARYLAIHPFEAGKEVALANLVEQSLARRHRWTGADCKCAGLSPARR